MYANPSISGYFQAPSGFVNTNFPLSNNLPNNSGFVRPASVWNPYQQ